jgi:hypothetical protein
MLQGLLVIDLQTGQASGAAEALAASPAGVQVDQQSGQATALVPATGGAAHTCAPCADECGPVGAGIVMQGVPGPQGPAGTITDYTATFASAASTWIVNHNLGREPAIQVLTPGGMEMEAAVVHVSVNQAQINFASPQTGRIRAV